MYRVLIVDDEPLIRKGLRESLEWDELELEISGEATNGKEAFEMVKKLNPAILITDIKMPIMDGIELIIAIKQENLKTRIIILSGYSDYKFLKQAIMMGVESYLLKPIDNDELIAILKSLVESIERDIFNNIKQREGEMALRSNTLNRLVKNNISEQEYMEKAAFLNLCTVANEFVVGVLIDTGRRKSALSDDKHLKSFALLNICDELTREIDCTSFIDNNGNIVQIFCSDSIFAQEIISEEIAKISEVLNLELVSSIGCSVERIAEVNKSYNQALECFQQIRFSGEGSILHLDNTKSALNEEIKIQNDEDSNTVKVSAAVREAIEHAKLNYNKDILLKTVADSIYINASYLGQIFRKETGESFTDYVNKIRIKKAIELLSATNLKVFEVAKKVGFSDSIYFFKIFRKHTGKSPSDYKNSEQIM